jgi:hypothetical protein
MPESEHSLPTRYDRPGDQIDGWTPYSTPSSCTADPRHPVPAQRVQHGQPAAACARGQDHRHRPDSLSVHTEQHQPGGPDHYVVNYDVWNHRDSLTFAKIVRTSSVTERPLPRPRRRARPELTARIAGGLT